MNTELAGRRVLFIAPRFFGYDRDIVDELRSRGAEVDTLPDRPFDAPFMKAVTRFRPDWVIGAASRLYRRKLMEYGRNSYDLVMVVNGQTLSGTMLRELRAAFPRARFVLYMWDSFYNRRQAVDNLRHFDDCLSFDPNCVHEYGMRFRPLFFPRGLERPVGEASTYHLSFVGTVHTDRYSIIRRISNQLPEWVRFQQYLYLQAPWVYQLLRLTNQHFRGARQEEFRFVPLDRATVHEIFFCSHAVLDIEHPRQTGLTIRTLEAVGANRKLVTTNAQIREYDFFRPENVQIIRRDSPEISIDFLEKPYQPLSKEIYRKYSLAGWMDDLLEGVTVKMRAEQ